MDRKLVILTLYLIETPFNTFANRVDPDQAALVRAAWSGSTMFARGNMIYLILYKATTQCLWWVSNWQPSDPMSNTLSLNHCAPNFGLVTSKKKRQISGIDAIIYWYGCVYRLCVNPLYILLYKGSLTVLALYAYFFWFPERCFWASSMVHVVSVQQVHLMASAS